jgi:hypothetical protein
MGVTTISVGALSSAGIAKDQKSIEPSSGNCQEFAWPGRLL